MPLQKTTSNAHKAGQRIERLFRKALKDYQLIDNDDHVLVALSGGKDSLLLVELLAKRSRIFMPRFNVSAVHVRMNNIPYKTDTQYLETFCKSIGVDLHVLTTEFDISTDRRKNPCFLCSWYRRKQIFELAQRLGCKKVALGHHQDDIIHTALMNVIFEGRFSSMPVIMQMEKMPLSIIRPLALVSEADIRVYAEAHQYQKLIKLCPYEHATYRQQIKDLYDTIEKMNPEARYSIWHALNDDLARLDM